MSRTWQASIFSLCLGLVVATGLLLLNPVPAFAGTCTADCGNGHTVTCAGEACFARNGDGCFVALGSGTDKLCSNSSDWDKPEAY